MVNPLVYLQEVASELRKVTWPNLTQARNMTILVIVVTLLMGVYIGGLDLGFQKLIGLLLNR